MTIISARVQVKRGWRWLAHVVCFLTNLIAWVDGDLAFVFFMKCLKPLCVYDGTPRGY